MRDEFVGDKGVSWGNDVVARIEKGVADEFVYFIRAISGDDVFAGEAKFLSAGIAQIKTAAIWIKLRCSDRGATCCDRSWRLDERVCVGSEFDGVAWMVIGLTRRLFG